MTALSKCGEKAFKWESQLMVLGKYPAGNITLSFAIFMAGASVSKVLLVFKHMGLCVYNVRTYFIHQHKFLLPVILKILGRISSCAGRKGQNNERYNLVWGWKI